MWLDWQLTHFDVIKILFAQLPIDMNYKIASYGQPWWEPCKLIMSHSCPFLPQTDLLKAPMSFILRSGIGRWYPLPASRMHTILIIIEGLILLNTPDLLSEGRVSTTAFVI